MLTRIITDNMKDLQSLQQLIDRCDEFYNAITGYPPGAAECQTFYCSVPEDKGYEDKHVLGLYTDDGDLIGAADVITRYPTDEQVELGMLLIDPKVRRRGYGRAFVEDIVAYLKAKGTFYRLRAEVQSAVPSGILFLEKLGFKKTGQTREWKYHSVSCPQYEMVLPL